MRFAMRADFAHLYMLNYSLDAQRLGALVPPPLRVLQRRGRGLVSVVLPRIERMRPALTGFPAVDYEMCGIRILVEHHPADGAVIKGVYFARIIIDPGWLGRLARLATPFSAQPGRVEKIRVDAEGASLGRAGEAAEWEPRQRLRLAVADDGGPFLRADVRVEAAASTGLPTGSVFADLEQARETFNDIAYGFAVAPTSRRVEIVQIVPTRAGEDSWPLVPLTVTDAWVRTLHDEPALAGAAVAREPCFYTGRVPRYWRWLWPQPVQEPNAARARVAGNEPAR